MNRMNRWDHFDIIVAVGICATLVGASLFVFAFGGAPAGLLDQRFEQTAPAALDPGGVMQEALGRAITESGTLRQIEQGNSQGNSLRARQEHLGRAIVAAAHARQARAEFMPALREEAGASLERMHGMMQANAGHAIVRAAQRMERAGRTSAAQILFQETLGRIVADLSERERVAMAQRQEVLGWTIVGRRLALDDYSGQIQQQLDAAVRDVGVMTARLEIEQPLAQEALGAAVLVAAMSAPSSAGSSPVLVASSEGGRVARRMGDSPYQAGVLLGAALFVMAWGLRSVAGSGPSLIGQKPVISWTTRYRKAG